MPGVADDGAVLHVLEGGRVHHLAVARHGNPHVGEARRLGRGHHLVALHVRLERLQRVHLAHDHAHAHALRAQRQAASAVAVARDDDGAPAHEAVRGADDAVERGLAGAVVVVEAVLRVGVVDVEHGVGERALGGHGHEAHDSRRGLLGAAHHVRQLVGELRVQRRVEVGAVVHDDLRVGGDDGLDMAVVGVGILAGDGEHVDAEIAHERGCGIVLGGQRVRSAQRDVRAGGRECAHEVRRLGGHVHAGADAHARERLLALEALADGREHGHVAVGPHDAGKALVGQRDVFDVVVLGHAASLCGDSNERVFDIVR